MQVSLALLGHPLGVTHMQCDVGMGCKVPHTSLVKLEPVSSLGPSAMTTALHPQARGEERPPSDRFIRPALRLCLRASQPASGGTTTLAVSSPAAHITLDALKRCSMPPSRWRAAAARVRDVVRAE